MFGFESISQLSHDIRSQLHRVPKDVDLVVGIPRSGMIPAYLLGLFVNRLVLDLDSFLAGRAAGHGSTRALGAEVRDPLSAKHILLVDDSLTSGGSMRKCVERVRMSAFGGRMTTCAAIVVPSMGGAVDISFREMPQPRIFEWNAFHHTEVVNSCFDLDGVLCVDPTERENDDGPRYGEFIRNARPLFVPTQRVGHIVSARLEKHRELTEEWLRRNGIAYGCLHLIDLPSQAERMRLGAHSKHKAKVYRSTGASLFYESDIEQAQEIAQLSGRPVLCPTNMNLYLPTGLTAAISLTNTKWHLKRPLGRLKGWLYRAALSGLASTQRDRVRVYQNFTANTSLRQSERANG
jgi:uncharacterized HAD superfamily protein/orotate phosphoribosyltransferase